MDNTIPVTNTVAMPPLDKLKWDIIEQYDLVLYYFRKHQRQAHRTGEQPSNHEFHADLETLFIRLEAHLHRWLDKEEFIKLEKQIQAHYFNDNLKAFRCINYWLDKKRLTRIDLESEYDTTSVEAENTAKGI